MSSPFGVDIVESKIVEIENRVKAAAQQAVRPAVLGAVALSAGAVVLSSIAIFAAKKAKR